MKTEPAALFLSKVLNKFRERVQHQQLARRRRACQFFVLKHPGIGVRNENGVNTGGERRIDVGFRAVADHPCAFGGQKMTLDHFTLPLCLIQEAF